MHRLILTMLMSDLLHLAALSAPGMPRSEGAELQRRQRRNSSHRAAVISCILDADWSTQRHMGL